jgi:hypothetical protein
MPLNRFYGYPIADHRLALSIFAVQIVLFGVYVTGSINEIKTRLGINCLYHNLPKSDISKSK